MNKKPNQLAIQILCALILLAISFSSVAAEEGGFTDGFDNQELPEWEHSPEAVVKDGVLTIGPGNLAFRQGNFPNFNAEFKVRYSGEGIILFRYNMHEGGDYACLFFNERVMIEKTASEQPNELASTDWSGFSGDWDTVKVVANSGQHEVYLNDELLLTAQDDDEPYSSGGLGFFLEGDSTAEFDSIAVTLVEGTGVVEENVSTPQENLAAAPTVQPTPKSGVEGILSQLAASQGNPPELSTFAVNLLLSAMLAYILSRVYVHWGTALSNRRRFAANFILITVTTTFIILIVRSSVALSLGLVGALSIVRFRAAIKEPEELAYLFFAIGIGIGLGDNQRLITMLAMAVAIIVIAVMRLFRGREADFNLHLTVASSNPSKTTLEAITNALKPHVSQSRLMRFDENKKMLEASFLVEFRNCKQFEAAKNALQALSGEIEITFLDNKGIG